jgi:hypothetical protein
VNPRVDQATIDYLKHCFRAHYDGAVREALKPGEEMRSDDLRRWMPSVVAKSRPKQRQLQDMFLHAWPAAIEKRIGQLRWINGKLVRSCPDWTSWDDDQLRQPPVISWVTGDPLRLSQLLSPHNKERQNGDIS